jgi:hypothetical protein
MCQICKSEITSAAAAVMPAAVPVEGPILEAMGISAAAGRPIAGDWNEDEISLQIGGVR